MWAWAPVRMPRTRSSTAPMRSRARDGVFALLSRVKTNGPTYRVRYAGRPLPPACKPGSVGRCRPDGHSSRNAVTRILQQPTRGVLVEVGASRRLFGLAPAGVYRAAPVAGCAVGSYPTFSPLPARDRQAVCFLWHCPSRHECRAQALPGSLPMEPGLSSMARSRRDRPAGGMLLPICTCKLTDPSDPRQGVADGDVARSRCG